MSNFDSIASQVSLPMPSEETSIVPGSNLCHAKPNVDNTQTKHGNLFVGSLSAAESSGFIEDHGITHILTVAAMLPVKIPFDCNVTHKIVECHDHPMESILNVLPDSVEFIVTAFKSGGNVLVHCASGVSRSVAVCAAFLMTQYDMNAHLALERITSVRKYANPNLGFRRQLEILEKSKGDIAAAKDILSQHNSDIVEDTIRQRELVNDLHAKVDELEVEAAFIKSKDHNADCTLIPDSSKAEGVKRELISLQMQLDSCLPRETFLIDPPAKMVRKAAITKIERLLESL